MQSHGIFAVFTNNLMVSIFPSNNRLAIHVKTTEILCSKLVCIVRGR